MSQERVAVIVPSYPGSPEYQHPEHRVPDSEPMWKAIVGNPFQYFMLVDRNGTIQFLNRAAPGIVLDDVVGKQTLFDFAAPEQLDAIRRKMDGVFRTGEAVHYQMYVPVLDEWYMVTAGASYEKGEIVGASVFAQGINEHELVEERLRESEQRYRAIVELACDGIALADFGGRIITANDSICKMLGYDREELVGMNFRELVPKEDLIDAPPEIDDLKNGKTIIKERRAVRKDGTIITVEGCFKALPGGTIQTIFRDITERKKAEDELRKVRDELECRVEERTRELEAANEAYQKTERLASIGTLAAGIAHEINNPLGSILMAADMGLYSLDDSREVEEALKSIKEDAKRAGRIVKTVLQFSRREESHQWPQHLGDVARRARDMTRSYAESRGVTVELTIAPNLPQVVINPTEIEQVFINIINNAIESSEGGQTISVRIAADGSDVCTVIDDHGRGMTSEEVARIFDPFYTTRQSDGGTGLGLSLSHSIIRQHGGSIDIDSRPGEGTRIFIHLPSERDERNRKNSRVDDR
jgi:PAS domain S-box-containing protein